MFSEQSYRFISETFSIEFSGLHYCLFVKVLRVLVWHNSITLSYVLKFVKNFLKYFYFSQPLLPQWVFILTRFFISVNMFSYLFLCSFGWAKKKNLDVAKISFLHFINKNGERGIWTLAPVTRPTPLAGAPLQPLEYFSSILNILYQYLIMRLSWRKIYYT